MALKILGYLCYLIALIDCCGIFFDFELFSPFVVKNYGADGSELHVYWGLFVFSTIGSILLGISDKFCDDDDDDDDDDDADDDDDLEDRDLDFDDDDLDDTNVSESNDDPSVYSPIPGTIIRMEVAVGDTVEAGQVVAIAEALKMEFEIKANRKGTVKEVLVAANDVVFAGQKIIHIE